MIIVVIYANPRERDYERNGSLLENFRTADTGSFQDKGCVQSSRGEDDESSCFDCELEWRYVGDGRRGSEMAGVDLKSAGISHHTLVYCRRRGRG